MIDDSPSTTTDALCRDCAHMRRDAEMRARCYSPQLQKLKYAGMIVNFERDGEVEPDRSHADGTGKCGTQGLNFKRRETV